jgi:hypothetical protein
LPKAYVVGVQKKLFVDGGALMYASIRLIVAFTLCMGCAFGHPALKQLGSGKVVFSFNLEEFKEAWQWLNQTLNTPFVEAQYSLIVESTSYGRVVRVSLGAEMFLYLGLDAHQEVITAISFHSNLPKNSYDEVILHNALTLLIGLLDAQIDDLTFDGLISPLKSKRPVRVSKGYHDLMYVSFSTRENQFRLTISPMQREF